MKPNNFMGSLTQLIAQGGNNPQVFAQSLLQNNPQFAKALQGQNPQQLAMAELQKRGINPNQIMQMFNRR